MRHKQSNNLFSFLAVEMLLQAVQFPADQYVDDAPLDQMYQQAASGLWQLACDPNSVGTLRAHGADAICKRLLQDPVMSDDVKRSVHGVLFNMGDTDHNPPPVAPIRAAALPRIMLSYSWSTQQTVLRIKKELSAAGLHVWIDVEAMAGDILDAMAQAVEQCDVFVFGMCTAYQASAACVRARL